MYNVFVYGTLRRGHTNHHMMKGAEYVGSYHTGPGWTKVVKDLPYLYPDKDGEGCYGEVYKVTKLHLELLDRFEGHPDFYTRETITVKNLDNTLSAYVYTYKKARM